MNIIQLQADDFYKLKFRDKVSYKDFIQELRNELNEYNKENHRLEFVDRILTLLKVGYDKHLEKCQFPNDKLKCIINKNYENILFFVQNEKTNLIENLDKSNFTIEDRNTINESLKKILEDINLIKMGQEITYDDLSQEFEELKEYYFLSKKSWTQLLIGRISEMVASGIISETISKEIVSTVVRNYPGLIQ